MSVLTRYLLRLLCILVQERGGEELLPKFFIYIISFHEILHKLWIIMFFFLPLRKLRLRENEKFLKVIQLANNKMSILTHLHAKLLQLCPTPCNPTDCSLPGSSVHAILQARILEWVAMPSSRQSSWPGDRTCVCLHWQVGSLPLASPGILFQKPCPLNCLQSQSQVTSTLNTVQVFRSWYVRH